MMSVCFYRIGECFSTRVLFKITERGSKMDCLVLTLILPMRYLTSREITREMAGDMDQAASTRV